MYVAASLGEDFNWTGCVKPDHGLSVVWPSAAKKQAHELDALLKDFSKIVRDSSVSADYKARWGEWLQSWQRHLKWVDGILVFHAADAMDRNDEYNCVLTKFKTELADELVPVKTQPGGATVAGGQPAGPATQKRPSGGGMWTVALLGVAALGLGVALSRPTARR